MSRTVIDLRIVKALSWYATFTDLRIAGVTLDEWLAHHRSAPGARVEETQSRRVA